MTKLLLLACLLFAEWGICSIVLSRWDSKAEPRLLVIDPSPVLTGRQKKLIYSGLPAYSSLVLIAGDKNQRQAIKSLACAIQYDLWDEKIQLIPKRGQATKTFNHIQQYYEQCVSFRLRASPQLATLIRNQTPLLLRVSLTQISGQTNDEIKDWLVGQQSSVLKGLFSHMLGDLRLEETQLLEVRLPTSNQEEP